MDRKISVFLLFSFCVNIFAFPMDETKAFSDLNEFEVEKSADMVVGSKRMVIDRFFVPCNGYCTHRATGCRDEYHITENMCSHLHACSDCVCCEKYERPTE